jgi:hypothetical protein
MVEPQDEATHHVYLKTYIALGHAPTTTDNIEKISGKIRVTESMDHKYLLLASPKYTFKKEQLLHHH